MAYPNQPPLIPGFTTPYTLKLHIDEVHIKADRHFCDLCGQGFRVLATLKMHISGHNKKPCPHCGKPVADMRQHIKVVHLGVRRGGIIRIPGLDSQGRPLEEGQAAINVSQGLPLAVAQSSTGTGNVPDPANNSLGLLIMDGQSLTGAGDVPMNQM